MLTTTCRPFNAHMHRVLEPVLSLPLGSAVLDAGCGTGTVARWLAERGHRVLGIDLEPPEDATTGAAGPVPSLDGGTLRLCCGDIFDLPREIPAGQTYDAVLLLGVLHYAGSAERVGRMLWAIDKVAAPGAPLAVSWICDEIPLSYESPPPLAGGPFRAENGVGCPLTSLLLGPCEAVHESGAGSCL
ncbi:MAG: class I SAM-dependent methyltransferase, partial [Pseudonocardiaceae bacterium]